MKMVCLRELESSHHEYRFGAEEIILLRVKLIATRDEFSQVRFLQ